MTKRTLLEGEYIPGLAYYDVVNVIDNTSGRVAITTGYNVSFAPDSGAALPTEPIQFLHIEMTIENAAAVAGLTSKPGSWRINSTFPTTRRSLHQSLPKTRTILLFPPQMTPLLSTNWSS